MLLTGKLAPWVLDTRHGPEVLRGDAQESSDLAGDPHDGPDLACHPHHAGVPPLPPPQGAGQASHPAPVWLHLPLLQVNPASTESSTIPVHSELWDAQTPRLRSFAKPDGTSMMPYDQDTTSYMSHLCHSDLRQHVSCTQSTAPILWALVHKQCKCSAEQCQSLKQSVTRHRGTGCLHNVQCLAACVSEHTFAHHSACPMASLEHSLSQCKHPAAVMNTRH